MILKRLNNIPIEAASHENPVNPGVFKQVLIQKNEAPEGKVQMINWATLPRGKHFTSHYHEDMEEIFIIIGGKVIMRVGNETFELKKGDLISVPQLASHEMWNKSETPATYIVIGVSLGKGGKTVLDVHSSKNTSY